MGYSNYYYTKPILDKDKFKILSEELSVASGFIVGEHSSANEGDEMVTLCDGVGEGSPIFNDDVICFNGDASKGHDHETFVIDRESKDDAGRDGLVFQFCKTARKPYDIMVQLSMLRLKHHFPETKISSDGDSADWKNGRKLYKKIFGTAAPKMNR